MTIPPGVSAWPRALLAACCFCACLGAAASDQQQDSDPAPPNAYKLGQGWRFGQSGWTLGGYSAVQYQYRSEDPDDAGFAPSHLSAFLWWQGGAGLTLFGEIDKQESHARGPLEADGEHTYVSLERLYLDYAMSDWLTVRLGKYLTPIGRWNQLHADPLVWTSSRPLITRDLFPDNASGAMLLGNVELGGMGADYALYYSPGRGLRPDPEQDPFSRGYGARLNVSLDAHWQVGLSYARFDQSAMRDEHKRLFGLDALWRNGGVEVSAEGVYRRAERARARGGFVQLVLPLHGALFAVGRVERLAMGGLDDASRQDVLGLTYRASRAVSLKIEAQHVRHGERTMPTAAQASVSVLF